MPDKTIQCDCGFTARGRTDDELVAVAQQHARAAHNIELTRSEILAMARPT
jgi:predicted small metal-binding protein